MARLYADENFPWPVVEALRRLGHDTLTMQESGKARQAIPDEVVLALASAEQRAVLTLNRKHFIQLHRVTPEHAGIIVCTFDPDFNGQAQRIHATLELLETLFNQLIRVNRP
jgi:predicted nuclease of predicted toxin-antitoxin system